VPRIRAAFVPELNVEIPCFLVIFDAREMGPAAMSKIMTIGRDSGFAAFQLPHRNGWRKFVFERFPSHEPHDILVPTALPPHEPRDILVPTALPHPSPLPLGEGELSPDGLKWRTITAVQGFNARFLGEISPAVGLLWRSKPLPFRGRGRIIGRWNGNGGIRKGGLHTPGRKRGRGVFLQATRLEATESAGRSTRGGIIY
jgi:hypothetical protein